VFAELAADREVVADCSRCRRASRRLSKSFELDRVDLDARALEEEREMSEALRLSRADGEAGELDLADASGEHEAGAPRAGAAVCAGSLASPSQLVNSAIREDGKTGCVLRGTSDKGRSVNLLRGPAAGTCRLWELCGGFVRTSPIGTHPAEAASPQHPYIKEKP
jgi:hypothetical protein